jgi:isopentenyl diphosphate isomerase/L-lactate dehydrogenase-like FMN-dependent dehydrogenase
MHNIGDLHRLAKRRLPKRRLPRGLYAMLERGAEDEVTMQRNRSDLAKLTLKPRTLAAGYEALVITTDTP